MTENVNHPDHYKAGDLEAIDIIEAYDLDFHLGNAVKYILRAGVKTEDPVDDLEKAVWYIQRFLDYKIRYVLTPEGKAVAELLKEGLQPPIVKNLGYNSTQDVVWELREDGLWHNRKFGRVITTQDIISKTRAIGGEFIDLDEVEDEEVKAPEPTPRQKAIDQIRAEGFYIPDGDELYYVSPTGSSWKLNDEGKWDGPHTTFETKEIIRFLKKDGHNKRGTLRSSNTGFRTLHNRMGAPLEGDVVIDRDGDPWNYTENCWVLFDQDPDVYGLYDLPDHSEPYRLPDEKDDK